MAVLFVGLALTMLLWRGQLASAHARAQVEFEAQSRELAHALEARLRLYRRSLRGARALFAASSDVTRTEWRHYIETLELNDPLPGIQGVGYAAYLPAAARPALEARMRREAYRDFHVWPTATNQAFSAILYLEPESGRNLRALGFDMHSEAIRRQAMDAARDNGDAALSGVVRLVQEGAANTTQPGFLLYMPVYRRQAVFNNVAARRAALQGWVYIALRGHDLVSAVLSEQARAPGFAVRIQDSQTLGAADIYRSQAWPARSQFVSSLDFDFSGRHWDIDFASLPAFEAAHSQNTATVILAAGVLISLMLALLAETLVRSRRRAELRAHSVSAELRKSDEQQRLMVEEIRDYSILLLDASGHIASWNQGAQQLKGYRADEILGRHFSLFYPPEDIRNGKPERELAEVRAHGRMEDEGWRVRRDGSRFWANVVITALHDADGQIKGYVKIARDLTQSRQVARLLTEANRLNTAILDGAAYSIIATDHDGTITVFNRAAEQMLGYRADEMIGKTTPAILHDPDEVAAYAAVLSRELGHPVAAGFEAFVAKARLNMTDEREWTYIRRDGSRLPVSLAVTALFNSDGDIDGFIGIAHDITERKRHEAELSVLFEQSPNATFLVDSQGRVQKLNGQAVALFGYAREELLGQPVELLLPETLRGGHAAQRSHYADAPRPRTMGTDMTLSARRKSGETFPVEVMLAPIEHSGEMQTLAIARDLTERKRHEAELTVLFEQSPNATFLVDSQGRVQKLNGQAVALFGYAREELLGQPVELLLPETLRGGHAAHRAAYANAPRTRAMGADLALSARRKNGEIFPIEVMLAPISIGGETQTLAIARDVTERKQHEEAQQKSLREKEVLLQEIHHRVKNNLQVIYSLLDLQADTLSDEATLRLFRDAQARVHAMALIHQTLYQSKNFAAVDLGAYLQTLLSDFAASHARPEIRLAKELNPVLLDVQSAVPCGLLINELLTNAYKHAFPNGRRGTLTVKLSQSDGDVQLVVADDGVGLAPDARTRGTLGMKLVEILAEQLHARLEYSGGPGTCVTLSFDIRGRLTDPPADSGA